MFHRDEWETHGEKGLMTRVRLDDSWKDAIREVVIEVLQEKGLIEEVSE